MNKQKELEIAFKDKIDWKFFNYLLDKITKYEDRGIDCAVYVYIPGLKENKVYTNPQKINICL